MLVQFSHCLSDVVLDTSYMGWAMSCWFNAGVVWSSVLFRFEGVVCSYLRVCCSDLQSGFVLACGRGLF